MNKKIKILISTLFLTVILLIAMYYSVPRIDKRFTKEFEKNNLKIVNRAVFVDNDLKVKNKENGFNGEILHRLFIIEQNEKKKYLYLFIHYLKNFSDDAISNELVEYEILYNNSEKIQKRRNAFQVDESSVGEIFENVLDFKDFKIVMEFNRKENKKIKFLNVKIETFIKKNDFKLLKTVKYIWNESYKNILYLTEYDDTFDEFYLKTKDEDGVL